MKCSHTHSFGAYKVLHSTANRLNDCREHSHRQHDPDYGNQCAGTVAVQRYPREFLKDIHGFAHLSFSSFTMRPSSIVMILPARKLIWQIFASVAESQCPQQLVKSFLIDLTAIHKQRKRYVFDRVKHRDQIVKLVNKSHMTAAKIASDPHSARKRPARSYIPFLRLDGQPRQKCKKALTCETYGPIIARNSPFSTEKETLSTALTLFSPLPYNFVRSSTLRISKVYTSLLNLMS